MDLLEAAASRRSIRQYVDAPVGRETLMKVLEAARLAPSWKNKQCWRYIVVEDTARRLALGEAVGMNPDETAYRAAPYVIVLCALPEDSGNRAGKPYYMTDCGISMQQLVLAAHALGLGTCWVGAFDEDAVRRLLEIPPEVRVVALTPLGVPAESPAARPRKSMEEIVSFEVWNG